MKTERFVLCLLLVFYILNLPVLAAADHVSELETRLAALENRFVSMQQDYQQQIASLTAQINYLQGKAPVGAVSPAGQQAPVAAATVDEADSELLALRQAAAAESRSAEAALPAKTSDEERRFIAGDLSRQAENPEISIVGDFVYRLQSIDNQRQNSDATMRNLGVHYETYLDPYTKFKGAVPVKEDISNIGEAYITRYGLTPNLNFTIGKFRQQFGIVQRWHMAGLDQNEFPLAMRRVLGDGGLCQNGISLDWQLGASGRTTHELTMQLTESTNQRLFAGNTRGMPSLLLHFKAFRDVNVDTYRELGLTALAGVNDQWSVNRAGVVERSMKPALYTGSALILPISGNRPTTCAIAISCGVPSFTASEKKFCGRILAIAAALPPGAATPICTGSSIVSLNQVCVSTTLSRTARNMQLCPALPWRPWQSLPTARMNGSSAPT